MTTKPLARVPIIVIVQDDVSRRIIAKPLKRAGAWVLECDHATQGMAYSQSGVELIIIDPDLWDFKNGVEMIRQMKGHHRTWHVPVIHVSPAPVAVADRVVGPQGADAYLTHPVDPTELVATAVDLLRRAGKDRVERERTALDADS